MISHVEAAALFSTRFPDSKKATEPYKDAASPATTYRFHKEQRPPQGDGEMAYFQSGIYHFNAPFNTSSPESQQPNYS